ncbi:hypothetical protein BD410DRAFT_806713 [Rickenella mellea]|uniref:Uncharacterized protein n=1 Tax=Rickenella mellea TaxID=50990 RepID=A0A4Y7PUA9_9AGAM|nr:hypothetical protein BD410DRAFT_806713 [Rickenella mellea]
MSSDDNTIVHDDIACPSYDTLLDAAVCLEAAEGLALLYRRYATPKERQWFYDNKDAAVTSLPTLRCTVFLTFQTITPEREGIVLDLFLVGSLCTRVTGPEDSSGLVAYSAPRSRFINKLFRDRLGASLTAALQAVTDACTAGKAAEANATPEQLNDPTNPAFGYKTLRYFIRFAILSIKNFNAHTLYIREIAMHAKNFTSLLAITPEVTAISAVTIRNACRRALLARISVSNPIYNNLIASKKSDFGSLLKYSSQKFYPGIPFRHLNEAQKAEVFADIVASSGRSNFTRGLLFKTAAAIGWAIVITTLSVLVYNIMQSQTDFVSAVGKILGEAAVLGAAWVGSVAAQALAIAVFGSEAVLTIALFSLCGGVIAGMSSTALVDGLAEIFEDMAGLT